MVRNCFEIENKGGDDEKRGDMGRNFEVELMVHHPSRATTSLPPLISAVDFEPTVG